MTEHRKANYRAIRSLKELRASTAGTSPVCGESPGPGRLIVEAVLWSGLLCVIIVSHSNTPCSIPEASRAANSRRGIKPSANRPTASGAVAAPAVASCGACCQLTSRTSFDKWPVRHYQQPLKKIWGSERYTSAPSPLAASTARTKYWLSAHRVSLGGGIARAQAERGWTRAERRAGLSGLGYEIRPNSLCKISDLSANRFISAVLRFLSAMVFEIACVLVTSSRSRSTNFASWLPALTSPISSSIT